MCLRRAPEKNIAGAVLDRAGLHGFVTYTQRTAGFGMEAGYFTSLSASQTIQHMCRLVTTMVYDKIQIIR
jgi:hypothetical protein